MSNFVKNAYQSSDWRYLKLVQFCIVKVGMRLRFLKRFGLQFNLHIFGAMKKQAMRSESDLDQIFNQ